MVFCNAKVCQAIGVNTNPYKYKALDGLRGLCAGLVVFHHLYWRDGSGIGFWSVDQLNGLEKVISLFIGQLPVAIFFIISGFLFYFIASNNKPVLPFLRGRILRIYPPVIFSLLLAFLAVYFVSDYNLNCSVGVFKYIPTPFGFLSGGTVCGLKMGVINSGVLWTLVWEWRLYIFVPILMIVLKLFKNQTAVVSVLAVFILMLWKTQLLDIMDASCLMLFVSGFYCAILSKKEMDRVKQSYCFILGLALFLVVLALTKRVYHPLIALSLIPVFLSVVNGFSVFGFLTSNKMQLLGVTSFTIYLNHGVFQFISKTYLYGYKLYLWQIVSVIGISLTAPFLYKYIEISFQAKKINRSAASITPSV